MQNYAKCWLIKLVVCCFSNTSFKVLESEKSYQESIDSRGHITASRRNLLYIYKVHFEPYPWTCLRVNFNHSPWTCLRVHSGPSPGLSSAPGVHQPWWRIRNNCYTIIIWVPPDDPVWRHCDPVFLHSFFLKILNTVIWPGFICNQWLLACWALFR